VPARKKSTPARKFVPARKSVRAAKLAPESLLGLPRAEVRKRLGRPSRRGDDFDSFFRAGLAVIYDLDGHAVRVCAAHFVSGDVYDERVLGVALGESRSACVALWGEPVRVRLRGRRRKYCLETWHHAGYVIEVEVWTRDGHEDGFGDFRAETVKEITVWHQEPAKRR
jgi:hypothetical protein